MASRLVWIALTAIGYNNVRAFGPGDVVPDSHVSLYHLDTQGLVQQVSTTDLADTVQHGVDLVSQAELDAVLNGRLSDAALRAAYVPRPTGGTDGQTLVKSGSDVVWGTVGGGGSAPTTSASDLTSGTLPVARIADGSLPAAKLDFAANGAFARYVNNGSSTSTPRPTGAGMVIWVGSVASANMADGDIRISTS